MFHEQITSFSQLDDITEAWDDLASHAADPNPFYEPWNLIPALRYLSDESVKIIAIWRDRHREALDALIPVQTHRRWRGLPVGHTTLWRHPYCFLCTPLFRQSHLEQAVQGFRSYLVSSKNIPVFFSLDRVPSDSQFLRLMTNNQDRLFRPTGETQITERAMASIEADYENHFLGQIRTKKRKELRRNRKRLSELGELVVDNIGQKHSEAELSSALADFFTLEADSWKGEGGTAILSTPTHQQYFESMMHAGVQRGQAFVSATRLDGKLIGGLLSIIAATGQHAYTLKIASSGDYQQYSIGSLIMLDVVEYAYSHGAIKEMDSCAKQNHPMINRLWLGRKQLSGLHLMPADDWRQAIVPATDWALRVIRRQ